MASQRPHIPRSIERRVLMEASHRCALPACRSTPVQIAHIIPWASVREHSFENLIALCPTCHSRYDRGEIDRASMRRYKDNLRLLNPHEAATAQFEISARVHAYLDFMAAMESWEAAINRVAYIDVSMGIDGIDEKAEKRSRDDCTKAWRNGEKALSQFMHVNTEETSRWAVNIYISMRAFADDVMDGLWPSTHLGADKNHGEDIGEYEKELLSSLSADTGLSIEYLERHARTPSWKDPHTRLGGTGKRF